ncbi:hypothetical protein HIM_05121 [Hirsutella minnesotensis 3608]|uniref:NAD(P)-binding domain-containing protein n=1 Tax=Hirsutella minnesotensis 3608 TaxID=1043627 RepID=A0A0F7ZPF8_9HYPO|nr:hypothetical protein HIM_05121 [Hirsutella minnesotensis 3608]
MAAACRPIKKVCLIGANGTLGSVILDCLIEAAKFDVTILRRHSSSSTTQAAHVPLVREVAISPHLGLEELTAALQGQDAVIAAFPPDDVSQHLRLQGRRRALLAHRL